MGDTTGQNIAYSILNKLQSVDLDVANMRAQAYDGTGVLFLIVLHKALQ